MNHDFKSILIAGLWAASMAALPLNAAPRKAATKADAEKSQLTNIPTIYIDTENGAGINSKETYTKCTVTTLSSVADEACTDVAAGIRSRGNSTWGMPKKPYRIKFDKKRNFMNHPAKAKSWVLLANYADKSLIRNAIAFEISRTVGMEFTPSIAFADVVVNGSYQGNYMVTDQMEVATGRIPVEEQEVTDTEEPAVTGGYLLEIDGFASSEPKWFQTTKGVPITIKYPKDDEINTAQETYIANFVKNFEDVLFSDGFDDPETGWRSLADEASVINWYIACELTGNSDSFWSTYIYKKRSDDHLYFGPLWDFDIAFNNDDRLGDSTEKLMRQSAHAPRTWIERLWQDSTFRTAVNDRWEALVADNLEEHLLERIDYYSTLINESQALNFQKWNILNQHVYHEVNTYSTYEEGVDQLRSFISRRIAFLSKEFHKTDPEIYRVEISADSIYHIGHSGGMYIGESDDQNVCLALPENAADIKFVPVEGKNGTWAILLPSGMYLGSNGRWDTLMFENTDDPMTHYTVERAEDGIYVKIKNVGMGRYLGTDQNEAGKRIYTDKNGQDQRHLWTLNVKPQVVEPDPDPDSDPEPDPDPDPDPDPEPDPEPDPDPDVAINGVSADASLMFNGVAVVAPEGTRAIEVYTIDGRLSMNASAEELSMESAAPGIYIAVATAADGRQLHIKFAKTR